MYATMDRERTTGSQKDRPRWLGRRKTTPREDLFIRMSRLRNRFKTARQTRDELNNMRPVNPILKNDCIETFLENLDSEQGAQLATSD